ncbi:hypothetical protein H4Q32_019292 [Labeo rohita]|uniref:Uncharacterized protein n=1 Tax=Labeo rohita TaxID=84645 RepID=A0ABQ8LKQ5_LABRO|nr:hypothetical protein H4Q32_019292 [Labeo rohita]
MTQSVVIGLLWAVHFGNGTPITITVTHSSVIYTQTAMWILGRNVSSEDDLINATPDPEPSPQSLHCVELKPEPTNDGEPKLAATTEPSLHGAPELRIAAQTSWRLRGFSIWTYMPTIPVSLVSAMEAVCELSARPESPEAHKCPPTLPLLPPLLLSSGSPSAHPQPTISSESRALPLPVNPAAPSWVLALSSLPWPSSPLAPPASLILLALPWSVIIHPSPQDSAPPASPRPSVSPGPSFSIPLAPPWSSVALAPPWPYGYPPLPWSPEPSVPPWPSGSSSSHWLIGSPSSPRASLPALVSLLESSMASPSSSSTVGCLSSCGLSPTWLLLLQVPPVSI